MQRGRPLPGVDGVDRVELVLRHLRGGGREEEQDQGVQRRGEAGGGRMRFLKMLSLFV